MTVREAGNDEAFHRGFEHTTFHIGGDVCLARGVDKWGLKGSREAENVSSWKIDTWLLR